MRWTRRLRLCTAGLVTASALFALPTAQAAEPRDGQLTDLVNPFIGTENEGNTYPGAAVPFGMVQFSPDTGHNTGYDHSQNHIRGFSLVHLSGVGCGLGGDLPVLPTTGDVTRTDYAKYEAEFSHDTEEAHPGSYKVGLKTGIEAELTATERTGVQRYTFPATDKANVLLNAGQSLHRTVSTKVEILDDRTVRTAITGSGFCQSTKPYTVYTITRFDRPFTTSGTWNGDTVTEGSRSRASTTGRTGAFVRFDTTDDRTVEATTALSYVDARGAAVNLRSEGGRSFDAVRGAAHRAWEDRLDDVRAQGGSDTLRRTFYSSLYRSFLAPNIGSDADGRYTGWDQRIHRAKGFTYYQNWSLWDTYRTQSQLLALLAPREARDMAISVIRIDEESGWLPKWGYGTVETNIMTGDPVTPFLTNAYQQGLLEGAAWIRRAGLSRAQEERRRRAASRLAAWWAARPTGSTSRTASRRTSRAARTRSPATRTTTTAPPRHWSTPCRTPCSARWHGISATPTTPRAIWRGPRTTARSTTVRPASSGRGTPPEPSPDRRTRPRARVSTRARPGSTSGSCRRICPAWWT